MTTRPQTEDTTVEALAEWSAEMTLLGLEVGAQRNQWAYHEIDDGCRLYAVWDGEAVLFRRSHEWLPAEISLAMGADPLTREQAAVVLRAHKTRIGAER